MNNKTTQIIAFVAFVVVAVAALYYGMNDDNTGTTSTTEPQGEPQAVHIIKYSDYQCPACKAYIPVQEQLEEEYGDLVEIEYRHFPLSGHQFADLAARSAEAARNQGKYKEMHDLIFEHQEEWARGGAYEHFTSYAEEIGLDVEQFEEDLESGEVNRIVESQKAEGERRTVNSTPTFFINGQKIQQNPQSYEQFKSMVEMFMYRSGR